MSDKIPNRPTCNMSGGEHSEFVIHFNNKLDVHVSVHCYHNCNCWPTRCNYFDLFIYLFILFIYLLLGINKSIKIVASCWSRIQFHNTMVKYPTEHYTALREAERNPLLERWFVPWFIDLGEAYLQVVDPESRCLTVLAWHYQDVIHVSSSTT